MASAILPDLNWIDIEVQAKSLSLKTLHIKKKGEARPGEAIHYTLGSSLVRYLHRQFPGSEKILPPTLVDSKGCAQAAPEPKPLVRPTS